MRLPKSTFSYEYNSWIQFFGGIGRISIPSAIDRTYNLNYSFETKLMVLLYCQLNSNDSLYKHTSPLSICTEIANLIIKSTHILR